MTEFNQNEATGFQIALKDLRGYFSAFAKSKEKHRLGAECEIFGLLKSTGQPIPYFGRQGIEGVLDELAQQFKWKKREENKHIIALERGNDLVTLEPGGQIELSASPVKTLREVDAQIKSFHRELKTVGEKLGVAWLSMGTQPLARAGEMPWVPKARYEIMRRYLATHGARSHDMMQRTATDQFNVDFESESHALEIMQMTFRIMPFVVTAFANSPLFEGRVTGYQSFRNHIWQGTDPDRSGLIENIASGGGSFEEYLDYVLDIPMFFIIRQREWIPLNGITFRNFLEKGFGIRHATMEDFNLHLTAIFPECRLKDHLEIRGMDAQSPEFIMAVFAFWKGLLENTETLRAALDVVKPFTYFEIQELYRDLPHEGLSKKADARSAGEISKQLFEIALFGLSSTKNAESQKTDLTFLRPFYDKFVKQFKTPAGEVLENWDKASSNNKWPAALEPFLL